MRPRPEFSFRTRSQALERFRNEKFDLLIIGGGITGAGVARDAARRGLKVALVERRDFASGTSSRSSKLVHGGLRYLENFEFGLVFEALSERSNLLKTSPHLVRPLKFFFPVYQGDSNGRFLLFLGMWLYDILSLFRAPGFHRSLSKRRLLREIPFLKARGLRGGFSYYDASMWDDVLAVEVLRSAHESGAAVANYVEAVEPLWENGRIMGYRARDCEEAGAHTITGDPFEIHASRVVICGGPWTDLLGHELSAEWKNQLAPSKGVHLIFDWKRIPVPGALVMSHPSDGRISFVIPRPDYGTGVVIVGTTESPSPADPSMVDIDPSDVRYLMELLARYFPDLNLTASDILSAYVGVRPLVASPGSEEAKALQKVSREHHIGRGPGGTTWVAGGKYTTYRKMAEEIVDFTLSEWRKDAEQGKIAPPEFDPHPAKTREPVNPHATGEAVAALLARAHEEGLEIPKELIQRYAADAPEILAIAAGAQSLPGSPEGFPRLDAQLRYSIRTELTMHLVDFYLRRLPLYASRADHGLPWAEELSRVWAVERGLGERERQTELEALRAEVARRSAWKTRT